ncbi:MAG: thiamine phosphate synthase [Pyrinomonadaceae bacterium]
MRRPRKAHKVPLSYLITSGETTSHTTQASDDYHRILKLVAHAVHAEISFIQIREKQLNARTLYHLTADAARLTRDTATRLLINDRADIAVAGGADGVHLTTQSLTTEVIRCIFGQELVIGVSTHSVQEASLARNGGADFVTFGPVYATSSKSALRPTRGP